MAALRRWAAARCWHRVPGWSRPLLIPLARLAWVGAASWQNVRFARRHRLPLTTATRLWVDCLLSGARPLDALIWRRIMASCRHPLPGRAAAVLLSRLGDPAAHRLLADKQATAELLSSAGLPTPPMLGMIAQGGGTPLDGPAWTSPGRLFVKPRRGFAGGGALAVEILADGNYRINGAAPGGPDHLRARLQAEAARDDLLIQLQLDAAPDLADLATAGAGAAPVLRLTIARAPGGAPVLRSALLCIAVPGRNARSFLHGHLYVPVDPADGRMGHGIAFTHAGQSFPQLPWNGAPLAGRPITGFDRAVAMTVHAMELVPGLPLVNWDLILTTDGPVILEGNSGGNWILTNIAETQFPKNESITGILLRWSQAAT